MVDTSRFQDADRYASYLKTAAGRLRSELAWENLRRVLPSNASRRRALDMGSGPGLTSQQLAQTGCEVTALDISAEMLGLARRQAEAPGLAARISFVHADARQLQELFTAESFDVVVCHNLLEYLEDPFKTIQDMAHLLRKGGVLSILVRNRAGEVLRAAVKSGDWSLASANLSAPTVVDTLFGEPVRVFAPAEVRNLLARAGLEIIAESGVRVFFDYLGCEDPSEEAYRQIFELEMKLGAQPEFAAIARYLQVIAVGARHSSTKENER